MKSATIAKVIALCMLLAITLATSPSRAVPGANLVVATVSTFVVDDVHVVSGAPTQFANLDPIRGPHDVASVEKDANGKRYFKTETIGPGMTEIDLSRVEAGRPYAFICSIHPQMVGTLTVEA